MKNILLLACLPVFLLGTVSCRKDKPEQYDSICKQWVKMNQTGKFANAILDISKKEIVWKLVEDKDLQCPELMYSDHDIIELQSIKKRQMKDLGDVWEFKTKAGGEFFIFDVTEESAKFVRNLDNAGESWELLLPAATAYKLTYHYVPMSAVDLGLSVYWATFNMQTTFPENFDPDKDYFDNDFSSSEPGIYTINPGSFHVNPETDLVNAQFGGKWRLPTKEEWEELHDNCSYNYSPAVEGFPYNCYYIFSKNPGYLRENIMITMNGRYVKGIQEYSENGYYWTSTPGSVTGTAYVAVLTPYNEIRCETTLRATGCNVRPVWDPKM